MLHLNQMAPWPLRCGYQRVGKRPNQGLPQGYQPDGDRFGAEDVKVVDASHRPSARMTPQEVTKLWKELKNEESGLQVHRAGGLFQNVSPPFPCRPHLRSDGLARETASNWFLNLK